MLNHVSTFVPQFFKWGDKVEERRSLLSTETTLFRVRYIFDEFVKSFAILWRDRTRNIALSVRSWCFRDRLKYEFVASRWIEVVLSFVWSLSVRLRLCIWFLTGVRCSLFEIVAGETKVEWSFWLYRWWAELVNMVADLEKCEEFPWFLVVVWTRMMNMFIEFVFIRIWLRRFRFV